MRRTLAIGMIVAAALALLILREQALSQAATSISFLPVESGSAVLIRSKSGTTLIGAGRTPAVFEQAGNVLPFFDRTIDRAILTDPKGANAGVLRELLSRYTVGQVIVGPSQSNDALALRAAAEAAAVPMREGRSGDRIDLGGGVVLRFVTKGSQRIPRIVIDAPRKTFAIPGEASLPDGVPASSLRAVVTTPSGTIIVVETTKAPSFPGVKNLASDGAWTVSLAP